MSDKAFDCAKDLTIAVINKTSEKYLKPDSILTFFETVYTKLKELEQQKSVKTQECQSRRMNGID